jgi:hypothetical protein
MESTKIDSKSAIGRSFIGAQSQFYRDASEAIPAIPENTSEAIPAIPEKRPEPQGKSMPISSMQKAVAAGTVRVSKEDTLTNLADIFTKTMAAPKKENLLEYVVFYP